jgi:hypothetical protein
MSLHGLFSMIKSIDLRQLQGHIKKLESIFTERLVGRHGELFRIDILNDRHGTTNLSLQRNSSTKDARSDRATDEVCGVVVDLGKNSILCSFMERWSRFSQKLYQFRQVSLFFFLTTSEKADVRQLFRLEWEHAAADERVARAAHPHWQFDRWLTASDEDTVQRLRPTFLGQPDTPIVFGSESVPAESGRPNLRWFTKLHFPAIAPWATTPISDLSNLNQPHSTVPNSTEGIEGWVDSALCYLGNELQTYGP